LAVHDVCPACVSEAQVTVAVPVQVPVLPYVHPAAVQ
jgi:hypothetical protein